jgi:tRNA(fMet)-specific endonuclease VapC
MAALYMLDTDTCSFIIRSNPETVRDKFLEHRDDEICISVITAAELKFGGIHKKSPLLIQRIKLFIGRLGIVTFDTAATDVYAEIRECLVSSGGLIGGLDMLIAASAISSNAILVSNNTNHFSRIPNLKLENWSI